MTTLDEMIAVMQAHKDGKVIQVKRYLSGRAEWSDIAEPWWNWSDFEYRIKPEKPKVEYRPFKNVGELVAYWEKYYMQTKIPANAMPFVWVKSKHATEKYVTTGFTENTVVLTGQIICSMTDLFDNWTFLNDEPCGVKIEI